MCEVEYPLGTFKAAPMVLTKAVFLWGTSGAGKTEFACAHFVCPLLVSHMDQLKKLCPSHDGIVFDDMSFTHYPENVIIHLLDMAKTRGVNVKHGYVEIPKGLPRIFTSNLSVWETFPYPSGTERVRAVERRMNVIEIKDPLF